MSIGGEEWDMLDHKAALAAYHVVQEDAGELDGPITSFSTVLLIIQTFLVERERLTR